MEYFAWFRTARQLLNGNGAFYIAAFYFTAVAKAIGMGGNGCHDGRQYWSLITFVVLSGRYGILIAVPNKWEVSRYVVRVHSQYILYYVCTYKISAGFCTTVPTVRYRTQWALVHYWCIEWEITTFFQAALHSSNRCWHFHPCGLNYKTSPATPQALWLVNQLRQYASSTVINQPTKAALEKTHHLLLSRLLNPIPVYKYSPRVTFRDM